MGPLRSITALTAVAAICAISACGTTPKPPRPLAQDVRNSLGTFGVVTVGPTVGGEIDGPVGVGGEAFVGVIEGAAVGTATGFGAGALLGLFCGPGAWLCVPVGALGGGVVGLVGGGTYGGIAKGKNAIPESAAVEIQAALGRAIADHELQADLRRLLLERTGSASPGIDLGIGARESVTSPDYASFAGRGVGTVLETSLTQLAFTGEGGSNPTLALVITARARLIRISDKRVLWNAEAVRYESSAAAFSLWTARDSGLLKAEIDNGLETLARQIREALFVASILPPGAYARFSTGNDPA